jgi:transcription termination factor Rho
MHKLEELNAKKVIDLQEIAQQLNIKKFDKLNKEELAYAILDHQAENAKTTEKPIRKQRPRTKSDKNETEASKKPKKS